ncbi:hypothetical protein BDK51DRAFT_38708 [Blyttiomyces helicus]|uniref:Uncharacterized protein n=1 Tax=Blyttiomyces helicus TaxID=388810 RepID=A0A4P9W222_9FUNG|nr:hypothetical protein BDK51DRAFT_38708 [Blyttiomyces helicus]|eukprot:RKO85223.1 hypothetical protein BDK51DRAFT_38708 [Blyttiomyces helicus]
MVSSFPEAPGSAVEGDSVAAGAVAHASGWAERAEDVDLDVGEDEDWVADDAGAGTVSMGTLAMGKTEDAPDLGPLVRRFVVPKRKESQLTPAVGPPEVEDDDWDLEGPLVRRIVVETRKESHHTTVEGPVEVEDEEGCDLEGPLPTRAQTTTSGPPAAAAANTICGSAIPPQPTVESLDEDFDLPPTSHPFVLTLSKTLEEDIESRTNVPGSRHVETRSPSPDWAWSRPGSPGPSAPTLIGQQNPHAAHSHHPAFHHHHHHPHPHPHRRSIPPSPTPSSTPSLVATCSSDDEETYDDVHFPPESSGPLALAPSTLTQGAAASTVAASPSAANEEEDDDFSKGLEVTDTELEAGRARLAGRSTRASRIPRLATAARSHTMPPTLAASSLGASMINLLRRPKGMEGAWGDGTELDGIQDLDVAGEVAVSRRWGGASVGKGVVVGKVTRLVGRTGSVGAVTAVKVAPAGVGPRRSEGSWSGSASGHPFTLQVPKDRIPLQAPKDRAPLHAPKDRTPPAVTRPDPRRPPSTSATPLRPTFVHPGVGISISHSHARQHGGGAGEGIGSGGSADRRGVGGHKKPRPRKKPTLIRNLNSGDMVKGSLSTSLPFSTLLLFPSTVPTHTPYSHIYLPHTVIGEMTYNPTLQKWEGNERALLAFDRPAPTRPALITPLSLLHRQSLVQTASPLTSPTSEAVAGKKMMFDPVAMRWVGNEGEEEGRVFEEIGEVGAESCRGEGEDWGYHPVDLRVCIGTCSVDAALVNIHTGISRICALAPIQGDHLRFRVPPQAVHRKVVPARCGRPASNWSGHHEGPPLRDSDSKHREMLSGLVPAS